MKLILIVAAALLVTAGCSHKETTSAQAQKALEEKYTPQIGTATKTELVQEFGNPEWCKPNEETGEETCRFYNKKGVQWMGDKMDRKHYEKFDQVVANFDSKGILRSFKADALR